MTETKKRPRTPAQIRAEQKYNEHARFVSLKLNTTTDADIIAKLAEVDNMQAYIKQCIRKELENERA